MFNTSGNSLLSSFYLPIIKFELPGRFGDTRISSNDYDHTQDQIIWS